MLHKKSKRKAPQIATTVLLFACPIALAEQAQAQTTSLTSLGSLGTQGAFSGPYAASLPVWQKPTAPQRTGIANQSQFPLGKNPSLFLERFPFVSPISSTPEEYQEQVRLATIALDKAKSALKTALTKQSDAQKALIPTKKALDTAISALEQANLAQSEQSGALLTAQQALDTAKSAHEQALQALVKAEERLTTKTTATATALANLTTAQQGVASQSSNLTTSNNSLASAQSSLSTAQSAQQQAQQVYDQAVVAYNQAKALANQPTYQIQPTTYQIPDANFLTGNEWIGDGTSQSGLPEIHSGHIHFSYIGTEVYQDILLYPRSIADYNFTVAVYNQDQNSVNQGEIPDTYGLRIYFYDANNNLIHQNELTSSAIHSWQDVTLQGTTNTTTEVAKVRIGVYGIDNGFWAGTYGPAMNNVRLTLGWITGTTQVSTTTATMPVDIGEGGEVTYTAPEGSTFISSNLRYESYNNPSCGEAVAPQGLGLNTIQLVADNSIYGDTCGGEVKHLVGTITYTAQAEPDPSYALSVTQAQTALSNSNNAVLVAQQAIANLQTTVSTNTADLSEAQEDLTAATTAYATAQSAQQEASVDKATASANKDSAQSALSSATLLYEAELSKNSTLESKQSKAESAKSVAEDSYALSADALEEASSQVSEAEAEVESAQEALDSIPEPEPEEPEAPEIPEGDPRELTDEQVNELVAEAEAVLESAEQGSPQYQQALEALAVAAQADDPQVPTELLAIPLLGETAAAVLETFNALGNIGADMAPQVREDAEKTIIASVIATGAAVQAVQVAAASAASAAASSTSSSTTRRSN